MKKHFALLAIIVCTLPGYSQTVLNGNFEINTLSSCQLNNANFFFNLLMSDCFAFGPASEIDIQNSSCGFSNPANGIWFISLATPVAGTSDKLALKLSSALVSGNSYQISFYEKADTTFTPVDSLIVGLSSDSSTTGVQIYSSQPLPQIGWTLKSFSFIAPITGNFITFGNKGFSRGWNFIDDVQIHTPAGINDFNTNKLVNIFPNPFSQQTNLQTGQILKDATLTVYNSHGQAVKQIKNISGQTVALSRDNLPSGLYYFRLTENNKLLAVDKLVITD